MNLKENFMRLIHASAFALLMLTIAPVGLFAADAKSDVTAAYAAWDAAFNKSDAKAIAAAYLPNAKLLSQPMRLLRARRRSSGFSLGSTPTA